MGGIQIKDQLLATKMHQIAQEEEEPQKEEGAKGQCPSSQVGLSKAFLGIGTGLEWSGMEWSGVEWNGMGGNRMQQDAKE